jgi:Sortase domain
MPAGPQPPLRPVAAVIPQTLLRAAGMTALLVGSLLLAGCQRPTAPDGDRVVAAPTTHAAARGTMRVGRPTRIVIPAIGVEARVVAVGLRADGAMEVPDVDLAGWYQPGPRPGERGPAVIVGHVDSRSGPAVFYALNQLRTGDRIVVGQDGSPASVFAVERLERQPKGALPVGRIWNRTGAPVLRLITCGGSFDRSTGHYRDNLIVYASLAG